MNIGADFADFAAAVAAVAGNTEMAVVAEGVEVVLSAEDRWDI